MRAGKAFFVLILGSPFGRDATGSVLFGDTGPRRQAMQTISAFAHFAVASLLVGVTICTAGLNFQ
jgi:hypothetical protein